MFDILSRKKAEGEVGRGMRHPLMRMREEFETLFDRFFGELPAGHEGAREMDRAWALDVNETEKEVVVRAEAPGFEAGDFEVQLGNQVLTITAKKEQKEEKKGEVTASRYAEFRRVIALPEGIDREKVEASYRNGVLEVHIGRTPEAMGKKIEVKS